MSNKNLINANKDWLNSLTEKYLLKLAELTAIVSEIEKTEKEIKALEYQSREVN